MVIPKRDHPCPLSWIHALLLEFQISTITNKTGIDNGAIVRLSVAQLNVLLLEYNKRILRFDAGGILEWLIICSGRRLVLVILLECSVDEC